MSRHTERGNTPVGRLISGDPWNKQTTDMDNRPIPEDKQPFWFAVAIEKNAPGMNEMLGLMFKAAQAGYGQAGHIMAQINMGLAATAFSWKIADGDEMRPNPTTGQQELRWKHGAGCWIVKFSTTIQIKAAKYHGDKGVYCDPSEIKRGFYVVVAYSTSANGNMDKTAGIYLNPETVILVPSDAEELVSGPSLEQQVGAGPGAYMPSGVTRTVHVPVSTPAPAQAAPAPSGMPSPAQAPATVGNGSGMPTPQTSMPSGGTTSPTSYGGYMAPPATGGGMPGA